MTAPIATSESDARDIHGAKLDLVLGFPPAPSTDGVRELLAELDAVRSQVARAFDQVQAKLAELVARDAEHARVVRNR